MPRDRACTAHLYDADCGGAAGAPTFACGPRGCRWFTGACVAADHVVSDCPSDDVCCHVTAHGMSPFESIGLRGEYLSVAAAMAIGPSVSGNLVVTIDPDVVVPTAPTCTGTHSFGDLCTGFSGIRFRVDDVTAGFAFEVWSNLVGADLLVEA